MDFDDFEYDDIDLDWDDFHQKGANHENHKVYHPAIILSSSSRKPGYIMPHSVGVSECTAV